MSDAVRLVADHPRGRVLLLSNSAWNLANFRRPVIEALVGAGHEVVAAGTADGSETLLTALGARFVPLPIDAGGTSPLADARLFANIVGLLRREGPDALLTFTVKPNIYGCLAARLLRLRAIPTVSGLGSAFIGGGRVAAIVERLFRAALASTPTVFFQNGDDRDLFVARGLVAPAKTRLVAGSGIDLDRFRPPPADPPLPFRFLFIGRMLKDKGLEELAEAARIMRTDGVEARIALLGGSGGTNPSAVPESVLARWDADDLFDRLGSTDDVRPHIAGAHCVILPSYREGLPRSLLEGAAMARPLVATDVPGCRDLVVDGETGLLCAARSGPDLARAMRAMIALGPERRAAMGAAGRALVERQFDQRLVAAAYLEALRR